MSGLAARLQKDQEVSEHRQAFWIIALHESHEEFVEARQKLLEAWGAMRNAEIALERKFDEFRSALLTAGGEG
jgi:hypothetical protein